MLKVPAKDPSRTNWCGPTAIAIITGKTYAEGRDLAAIAKIKGGRSTKRVVKGLGRSAIVRALKRADVKVAAAWQKFPDKPTLMRLDERLKPRRFYLVIVGNHYVTVNTHDWTVCCNWSRAWVAFRDHPFNRSRVTEVIEVTPAPEAFGVTTPLAEVAAPAKIEYLGAQFIDELAA